MKFNAGDKVMIRADATPKDFESVGWLPLFYSYIQDRFVGTVINGHSRSGKIVYTVCFDHPDDCDFNYPEDVLIAADGGEKKEEEKMELKLGDYVKIEFKSKGYDDVYGVVYAETKDGFKISIPTLGVPITYYYKKGYIRTWNQYAQNGHGIELSVVNKEDIEYYKMDNISEDMANMLDSILNDYYFFYEYSEEDKKLLAEIKGVFGIK